MGITSGKKANQTYVELAETGNGRLVTAVEGSGREEKGQ